MTGLLVGVDNTTALEIIELERALQDDCKCQSAHLDFPCSVEVVARKITTCGLEILICQNSVDWNDECIASNYLVCQDCDRLCADCWKVIPV